VLESWNAYQFEFTYTFAAAGAAAATVVALSVVVFKPAALSVEFTNTAPVEVAVSINWKLRAGVKAAVVAAGHDFLIAVMEYESLAAKPKPLTVTVPAVVESEAEPSSDPVPLAVVIVS
jgi:hypothetical protein